MTEAKIPDSVESIGTDAFLSCDNLADVTVPSSVKQFGAHVFVATPWMEAKRASEGVVIRNNIVLDGYSAALEDEDVVLPGNVTAITNAAFSDSSVKSVVIPEGCVSIGSGAFNPCHEMEKITIPESVTEFGENIFNCKEGFYIIGKEGSAAETYASENSIPFQVEGSADDTRTMKFEVVDDHAVLTNYYGKEEAVIPASYKDVPVTEIGNDAFKNTAVQSVVIPDSVTKIGNWAFYGCGSLSQIVIPASVKEIGEYAFDSTGLASITVPGTVEKIGVSAFGSCKSLLEATVSEGIKELPERMFTMCESLDTVSLPKTLTLIGREAFYQTAIPGISIPETVTEIGDYAFAGSKLAEVTIPGSVAKIGSSAFEGCSNMASATMKDGVKELCDYAFKNCEFLEIVNIPASCTAIHANCFEGTAWLKAKQAENPLVIVNGILIDASTASGKVIVPNTVTAIAGGSFVNNEENPVTSILIPTSVTLIEDSFYWWRWTGYDITIYCYKGSEAEKFCKSNGIAYLMFGDVNDDKELNLKDAVLIRRFIAGGWNIKLDEYVGDINGDGTLNLKDVVLIRRFIAGGWNVKF